jgi:ERCC4-type nuclease
LLLIDRRVGSKDLLKPLKSAGLDAEIVELEFADVAFSGKGAKGASVDIGIELKTLTDLVGSLRSGRLAGHQLPGLRAHYEHAWLVVEGLWRTNETGHVTTYQGKTRGWVPLHGKMSSSELEKQVLTLELCGGLHARYTNARADTVRFICNLYRWWTDIALDHHTSHLAIHDQPTLVPISAYRQAFCKLPGVGVKASKAVAEHFGNSMRKASEATLDEWANIKVHDESTGKSRRLGESIAERIILFLDGQK